MEPTTPIDEPGRGGGDEYLDTVALLQEELGRLVAELGARDEATVDQPAPAAPDVDEESARRIDELTALLAERDETIGLLWEQLAALEETKEARAAEWDELTRSVEELEARIGDGRDSSDTGRREADSLRDQLEAQRKASDAQRRRSEEEIAGLRARLDEATAGSGDAATEALELENRRLRDECRRLAASEADAAAASERVSGLLAELEEARGLLRAAEDGLRDERQRHEAELAAIRSERPAARPSAADLSPAERIRALRDHFREVHEKEEQQRKERQLSARLARLWQRTGSGQ